MFDANSRNLPASKHVSKNHTYRKQMEKKDTSAIKIRLKAFAIEASTPTKSKSILRFDNLWTFT